MALFAKLTEVFKYHETLIESNDSGEYFVIINPFWDENIRVSNEDGIIFFFSFQHAHFDYCSSIEENIECLIDYINDFLYDKQVLMEFISEGANLFGGSRYIENIDNSSGGALLKSFFGDNMSLYEKFYEDLKGSRCRCSIRGWDSKYNKDIDFVL